MAEKSLKGKIEIHNFTLRTYASNCKRKDIVKAAVVCHLVLTSSLH